MPTFIAREDSHLTAPFSPSMLLSDIQEGFSVGQYPIHSPKRWHLKSSSEIGTWNSLNWFIIEPGRSSAGISALDRWVGTWARQSRIQLDLVKELTTLFSSHSLLTSQQWQEKIFEVSEADWIESEGWERPSSRTRTEAIDLIGSCSWLPIFAEPNVTTSPEGRIVFEWWNMERKLTIYVGDEGYEYIKVWGSDMDDEMEDGFARNLLEIYPLLSWLHG